MLIEKDIDITARPTEEQVEMLRALQNRSVEPDVDCPEQTDSELMEFRRISDEFGQNNQKQTVTLRLSAQTVQKAKMLGKGYTTILAQVIENALRSPETLEKSLQIK